jgi:hypothetical protein
MIVDMKTKNNDNEVVTRGVLRASFQEFAIVFAAQMEKMLDRKLGELEVRIYIRVEEMIDTKIGDLGIMIEKGFESVTKDIAILTERIGIHENYTQDAIAGHKVRIVKLEKKIK